MAEFARKLLAEFVGTAILLAAVVGSGIMGDKLSGGNTGIALLANSLATGGILVALISSLGPVSGAQFNPAVSLFEAAGGRMRWSHAIAYMPAQIVGAVAGVVVAHAMFGLDLIQASSHARSTGGELIGELVATFGLLLTIWGTARSHGASVPYAVAAYIVGAYWFTSSTSFANPAVTLARSLTDTFAGIEAGSVPGFVVAQLIAVAFAFLVTRLLAAPERG